MRFLFYSCYSNLFHRFTTSVSTSVRMPALAARMPDLDRRSWNFQGWQLIGEVLRASVSIQLVESLQALALKNLHLNGMWFTSTSVPIGFFVRSMNLWYWFGDHRWKSALSVPSALPALYITAQPNCRKSLCNEALKIMVFFSFFFVSARGQKSSSLLRLDCARFRDWILLTLLAENMLHYIYLFTY